MAVRMASGFIPARVIIMVRMSRSSIPATGTPSVVVSTPTVRRTASTSASRWWAPARRMSVPSMSKRTSALSKLYYSGARAAGHFVPGNAETSLGAADTSVCATLPAGATIRVMEIELPKGKKLRLLVGDITKIRVDAIVNAANSGLRGGGGVDGAIHRAGGPAIMRELDEIRGCPTGSAVVTTAGALPARYVFHAVGPIYRDGKHGD